MLTEKCWTKISQSSKQQKEKLNKTLWNEIFLLIPKDFSYAIVCRM